jgi:hypothetical protein
VYRIGDGNVGISAIEFQGFAGHAIHPFPGSHNNAADVFAFGISDYFPLAFIEVPRGDDSSRINHGTTWISQEQDNSDNNV